MNIKNYQYLTDSLASMGFGENLNNALKTKMELNFEKFEIGAGAKFGIDKMLYNLQFEKGKPNEQGEVYYSMNNIKTSLAKENGEKADQEFKIFMSRGFTAKEMYNLLDGRPVYKVSKEFGVKEGRWTKLDFASTDESGNAMVRRYPDSTTHLSLEREISKLPIPLARPNEKEQLIWDLQSGERVEVTMKQGGRIEKGYIEVAPQMGGLKLYDSEMKVIKHTNTHSVELVADEKVSNTNGTEQKIGEGKQGEKIPDITKDLIKKANSQESKEGMKQRRA